MEEKTPTCHKSIIDCLQPPKPISPRLSTPRAVCAGPAADPVVTVCGAGLRTSRKPTSASRAFGTCSHHFRKRAIYLLCAQAGLVGRWAVARSSADHPDRRVR
jgi:hypothetical protein